jgi:hypothetical protein
MLYVVIGLTAIGARIMRDYKAMPARPPRTEGNRPPDDALEPFLAREHIEVDGVAVKVGVVAPSTVERLRFAEIRARAVGSLAPRLLWAHGWKRPVMPPHGDELQRLPTIAAGTCGDELATCALPVLAESRRQIIAGSSHVVLACDGAEVVAWIDEPRSSREIELAIAAVVAIARWDAALAAMLAALPDAQLLPALEPAVLLPGDVRVGQRGTALIAQLGTRTREVERVPARILAVADSLRADATTTPYR